MSAIFCLAIPVLHLLGALPPAVLLILAACLGAARGPGDAAKTALVPELARSSQLSLERVAGLTSSVSRLAGSIGPALAGLLVAGTGPLAAVAVDALSFAVSAALIRATMPAGRRAAKTAAPPEPYLSQLRAGVSFLRGDSLLLRLALMATVTNLLDIGVMAVLLPVWARDHGGPISIGLITMAISIAALGGSLLASGVAERLPRRQTYFVAFLLGGAPRIALLAFDLPTWTVVLAWAASGLALGFVNPILSAVMFERIPEALIGRVSALTGTLSSAGTPLGGLAAGGLVSVIGLTATASTFAAGYLAATMAPAFGSGWRGMERADATTPTKPTGLTEQATQVGPAVVTQGQPNPAVEPSTAASSASTSRR